MCKLELSVAIVVSVAIALYELLFWGNELAWIIAILALISAYYGYFLLKCCSCCKTTKRKR